MPPVVSVRETSSKPSSRVRFDSVDTNIEPVRSSRERTKESRKNVSEVRKRTQSTPGIRVKPDTVYYCDLYKVVHVDQTGGVLSSLYFDGREVYFDTKYTQFNGASFQVEQVDELIRKNDYVIVLQKYPYNLSGRIEWRAKDIRYPNPATDPEFLQKNKSAKGDEVWVVHGRILLASSTEKSDMVIATGIENFSVFATKSTCFGDATKFEKNVTVLVRAVKRCDGFQKKGANYEWHSANVQIAGQLKQGNGWLKQLQHGRHKLFVIIANGFGYVLLPSESQRLCTKALTDGVPVSFVACSNLPCTKVGSKSIYGWRAVKAVTDERSKKIDNEAQESTATAKTEREIRILPPVSGYSRATVAPSGASCITCQGELVCLCFM